MKNSITRVLTFLFCVFSMPIWAQTVIENFDQGYTLGDMLGQGPEIDGWTGVWTQPSTYTGKMEIVSGGLLSNSGNKLVLNPKLNATTNYFRDLTGDWTDKGEDVWVSFYMHRTNETTIKTYGGLTLFDGATECMFVGSSNNSDKIGFAGGVVTDVSDYQLNHILVKCKMNGKPDVTDEAFMWVNYTGSTPPDESTCQAKRTCGKNGFNKIRLSCNEKYTIHLDNIKITKDFSVITSVFPTEEEKVTVLPNPVVNHLNFSVLADEVCIYNIGGKLITKAQNVNRIDVSHLQAGVYVAKLYHQGRMTTEKIIKK